MKINIRNAAITCCFILFTAASYAGVDQSWKDDDALSSYGSGLPSILAIPFCLFVAWLLLQVPGIEFIILLMSALGVLYGFKSGSIGIAIGCGVACYLAYRKMKSS